MPGSREQGQAGTADPGRQAELRAPHEYAQDLGGSSHRGPHLPL